MLQIQAFNRCPETTRAWALSVFIGLVLAGCANHIKTCHYGGCADAAASLVGAEWVVEDIAARGVMDYARTTIKFAADGRVSGNTSCNTYFGQYQLSGSIITVENIGMTKRACVPAVMDQERRFLNLLYDVRSYRIDHTGALLLAAPDDTTMTARRSHATPRTIYACSDGSIIEASYPTDDTARIVYQGESIDMTAAVSASGVRYVGGGWQWWTKGLDEATLTPLGDSENIATARGERCQRQ